MRLFTKKCIHALNDRGEDTGPYLTRWTILEISGWSLKLHMFHRGDEDRDLHDHPWTFWSLILRGGYWEHTAAPARLASPCPACGRSYKGQGSAYFGPACSRGDFCCVNDRATKRRWYRPGSFLYRPAPSPHRIELASGSEGKVWTLVLTRPKSREWGFHTICGWIPWTGYKQAKEDGC